MHNNENVVWQQERDDLWHDRFLSGDYDYDVSTTFYFYKLLKIGIVTLYLILFVEFVRHTIDHTALGRPFFTAVLTMVYSECK